MKVKLTKDNYLILEKDGQEYRYLIHPSICDEGYLKGLLSFAYGELMAGEKEKFIQNLLPVVQKLVERRKNERRENVK